ncbi:protein-L-isoaspartate(D-aspartate) O-methyltransferase [Hephaestia sp. GCM10023244]|uniref:protein-L-isoaspartate(D-aspartate) O-methyltransferase n=1 Tax=unclassified Hephaestia TaxID=2631281 RepID=UPI0020775825|nr:protein-L-isoaspartate(D-aspartate) O-methyltransferase [Hephaestia sp. MAHUQ-44]MCM8730474.1 protein-L-isoaspartate(D-aspartate) O-methyltransferase [Hephaestia sp. MAHUQ-44]
MTNFVERRHYMVANQIAARGIADAAVLDAMRRVPRDVFVDPAYADRAYDDTPLPIADGQTISQPYIVAAMIEAAALGPGDRVLEVGAGSGYAAAVIGQIAARVIAIERHPALAEAAAMRLAALGYDNIAIRIGDGITGAADAAPFDAIIVSAGARHVPATLKAHLAIGGRLVIPTGHPGNQRLLKLTRTGKDAFAQEDLGGVAFVPLIGAEGWR